MYLPSFYKLGYENWMFRCRRLSSLGPVCVVWGIWAFYPQLYNTVYTDFIPPAKGVERRIAAE